MLYKIVIDTIKNATLETVVNRYLRDGWRPIGGPFQVSAWNLDKP